MKLGFRSTGLTLRAPVRERERESEREGFRDNKWEFPKIRGTLFWVLIIRILLFRVLY